VRHIDDLENRRYPQIARTLQISVEEVLAAAKLISGLDPRPGVSTGRMTFHYIIPDIFVYKIGDDYVVVLNDEVFPTCASTPFIAAPSPAR